MNPLATNRVMIAQKPFQKTVKRGNMEQIEKMIPKEPR
jgi:hypothetical protein